MAIIDKTKNYKLYFIKEMVDGRPVLTSRVA